MKDINKELDNLKIVDVILHQNRYWIILNRYPNYLYEEIEPNFFQAQDTFAFKALHYLKAYGSVQAFAGRKFTEKMVDGSELKCEGSHWSVAPLSKKDEPLIDVGISSFDELRECYVFYSGWIKESALTEWLKHNEPKTDYYYYDNLPTEEESYDQIKEWKENKHKAYNVCAEFNPLVRVKYTKEVFEELDRWKSKFDSCLKERRKQESLLNDLIMSELERLVEDHGIDDADELWSIVDDNGWDLYVDLEEVDSLVGYSRPSEY